MARRLLQRHADYVDLLSQVSKTREVMYDQTCMATISSRRCGAGSQ